MQIPIKIHKILLKVTNSGFNHLLLDLLDIVAALSKLLIFSSDDFGCFRLSLYQKIGIAGTGVFVSAPTLAAAADENRCEYVPATEAEEPAACPNSAEN